MREYFFRNLRVLNRYLQMSDTKWLLLSSILVGAVTGFTAYIFNLLIHLCNSLFFDKSASLFVSLGLGRWAHYGVIVVPIIGGLLVGLITHFWSHPETKGHGVPEVMYAVARREGKIHPSVAVTKSIVSAITIGSGGSVGKEGPIVQIGSALGSTVGQMFRLSGELTRMLVACGAAGGIAATFGTPIAGVMFALEIILNEFAGRAFSMVVISSVTATVVAGSLMGADAFVSAPHYVLVSPWELLFYALLGVVAAFAGRLFVKTLYGLEHIFDNLHVPEYLKPAIGGIGIGVFGFFLPQLFGTGHSATEAALRGEFGFTLLAILAFSKIAASSLTLGSGGSGGVFSPSIFIGAMLGGAIGSILHRIFPAITGTAGAYAMVGTAAVLAGTMRAPITAIIIVYEMTNDFHIILPVMIVSVISTLVSAALSRDTIYTLDLRSRGVDLEADKAAGVLAKHRVRDVMTQNVETVSEATSLAQLIDKLGSTGHSAFPVINGKGELSGIVDARNVYEALPLRDELGEVVRVKEIMQTDPILTYPDERLDETARKLHLKHLDYLVVVDRNSPKILLGIISHVDMMKAYHKVWEPIFA